jgi:hypothetical protein
VPAGRPDRPGELWYEVAGTAEPPDAPLTAASTVKVRLALVAPEDKEILRTQGVAAMRQARVLRLAREAQRQGGLLSVEDLAFLTCTSSQSIERDLAMTLARSSSLVPEVNVGAAAAPVGRIDDGAASARSLPLEAGRDVLDVPAAWAKGPATDGAAATDVCAAPVEADLGASGAVWREPAGPQLDDIGRSLSRKAEVVQLYLWGLPIGDIEVRTRHPEGSIRRYLSDFRQVVALHIQGVRAPEIRAITGGSPLLIAEYIGLYERARQEFPAAPRLHELLNEPPETKRRGRR